MFQFEDMNAPALPQSTGPLAGLSQQQRRPYTQWGALQSWNGIGYQKFEGGFISLKNNEWHGWTLLGNITWDRELSSSAWRYADVGVSNFHFPYVWAGPYGFPPVRFVAGYSYRLPFGRGKAFGGSLSSGLNGLVSGWTVTGRTTFAEGIFDFVRSQDLTDTGLYFAMPNRICDARNFPSRNRLEWYNTACFVNPPFGVLGNATLGDIQKAPINNFDLALLKSTATKFPKESGRVEFRVEMFNAFNVTQWGDPNGSLTSSNYGKITSTRPARETQMSLRYVF
jgi:hypothetical protein